MFQSMTIVMIAGCLALAPSAAEGDPYDVLLGNPRVTDAIESSPFIALGEYLGFLRMKIAQLEIGQTDSWNDYRHPSPHTDQEITEVVLQKVALSLYVEVNELVPWSLLDYDDENLRIVLGDAFSEGSSSPYLDRDVLVNLNPLLPFEYAQNLRSLYPNHSISSAQDLVDLTIIKMRDDGWGHLGSGYTYEYGCRSIGYLGGVIDFECAELVKLGTSAVTPRFIYSVLHAQNIPSRLISWFGGGGIEFPSLGLGMGGNAAYATLQAGLRLRPNFLPVDITYLEYSLFEKWIAMGTCQALHLGSQRDALEYLSIFDDPAWNADVLESYCYRTKFLTAPGDFLRKSLVEGQLGISCQDEDPGAEDYQAPAVTDEEFAVWFAAIAEFTPECAACTVDADCDDGEMCNGQDYCDQFGFCNVWFPLNCNDGLTCTYDRCEDSECVFPPALYGDVNADEVVDLTDILCVLDGFAGLFDTCTPESLDIANCTPDNQVDLADILAVLDGFQGLDPCCGN